MHVKPPDHSVTEPSPNADIPTLIGMPLIFFFVATRAGRVLFFFFKRVYDASPISTQEEIPL